MSIFGKELIQHKAQPATPCAYSTHNSAAKRIAVLDTGTRFPLCFSHRQGEIRGFVRWEKLPVAIAAAEGR